MRYPRNALILDASTRREQVLSRENAILETCKDSRLCCCCFWLLSESAVSALIRTRRIRQASEQNATVQMLIVCESCLYSLQICIRIWYNAIIKTAIKCDIHCKIKPCNCRLLLRTTYYAPVAELAYAADSNSVFSGFNSRLEYQKFRNRFRGQFREHYKRCDHRETHRRAS